LLISNLIPCQQIVEVMGRVKCSPGQGLAGPRLLYILSQARVLLGQDHCISSAMAYTVVVDQQSRLGSTTKSYVTKILVSSNVGVILMKR